MSDELDLSHCLNAHDTEETVMTVVVSPKGDPASDVILELVGGHVRIVPTVGRNDPAIAFGRSVHDRKYRGVLVHAAEPDTVHAGRAALVSCAKGTGCVYSLATRSGSTGAPSKWTVASALSQA
jgi:hypothetical protein